MTEETAIDCGEELKKLGAQCTTHEQSLTVALIGVLFQNAMETSRCATILERIATVLEASRVDLPSKRGSE